MFFDKYTFPTPRIEVNHVGLPKLPLHKCLLHHASLPKLDISSNTMSDFILKLIAIQ